MVISDSRSSTYMSQGPSWSVAFIHVTLSTRRMFAVTPMRAICSLLPVDAVAADGLAHAEIAEDRMGSALGRHRLAVLGHGDLHRRHHRRRFLAGHDVGLRVLRLHRVDVLG